MQTRYISLAAATLLVALTGQAQQSPSPSISAQSAQVQAQPKPAPCVQTKPVNASTQIQIKPTSRWQKLLDKERAKIEKSTGISLPETSLNDLARQIQAPAPCPTPTPAPAVSPAAPASTPAPTNPKQ